MLSFYMSSIIVVFLRTLLFMDPFAHYCFSTYVYFSSVPTYIYCLTGFSLFLMIFESILKYSNLQTNDNTMLSPEQKEAKIKFVKKIIAILNWFPLICTIAIILSIAFREITCTINDKCDSTKTYIGLMPVIIINFVNMILLILVVVKFLYEINKRFGNSYRRAKLTVSTYMLLFSLSFLIRGVTDILQD